MEKIRQILLFLFFFSLNFEIWDPLQTNGYFSIAKLTGILYFLSSLPAIINGKTTIENKRILYPLLAFFCYLVFINLVYAESTQDTIIDFTLLQNIILFFVLINHSIQKPKVLEKALMFFALGSTTLAMLYYNDIGIQIVDGRVSMFGDNENIIAQRMCFSIIIITMVVLQNSLRLSYKRYALLLTLPLMFGLLVATGSRLSLISLAIIFIAAITLYKTDGYFVKFVVLLTGAIVFVFLFQIAFENEVVRDRLLLSFQEGNLSERDVIWQEIIPLIQEKPIFGIGQSGYAIYCISVFGRYWSPHNVILEVLSFTGFFGFLLYLIFLFKVFKNAYLTYVKYDMLLPALLTINVLGILLASHLLEVKIGWAILAYISTSYSNEYFMRH